MNPEEGARDREEAQARADKTPKKKSEEDKE
jgi:hypothetical protein